MMGLRDLGGALWRQRLLVLLVLVVTALAVVVGLDLAPRSYTATASVRAVVDPAVDAGREDTDALRRSLAALADSRAVVEQARRTTSTGRDVADLQDHISGRWVDGTVLIEVSAEDRDPQVAADLADAAAEALVLGDPDQVFLLDVVERADVPRTAAPPDLLLVVGLGVVVALGIAVLAAALRDARARTVDDGAEAEEATSAPLLAHLVPPTDPTVMPALDPGTAAAEAFHRLVVALESETASKPVSRVVVAGVTAGEVSAWVGANIALTLARPDRRVLLVDGRLGPQPGRPVEEEPPTAGLHDVLRGTPLVDALSPGPARGLSVVPSGGWGSGPGETALEGFSRFVEQADQVADVSVVLGPPLDASDDARVMAAGAVLLLVVPTGRLSTAELRAHADRVRAAGARLAGVVLVSARPGRRG